MIYTVTFNPALDYVVGVENLALGDVNRTTFEEVYYGGKGINVSLILKELEVPSIALGFVAGFTGEAIRQGVTDLGIQTNFTQLKRGLSRINVKLKAQEETEINGQGPTIGEEALQDLFTKLDTLQQGDTLVLAGSIPNTMPEDIYQRIMERLASKDIRFVVDATKDLLMNVLQYEPFLIKPNNHELGEIVGRKLNTSEEIVLAAKELKEKGAQNVLVSMAGDGAILVTKDDQVYQMEAFKGVVKNSVGAGDSMVAGFLAGYLQFNTYEKALHMGSAAGSATAFSKGLATKEQIMQLFKQI
jgi:1-phosphofructokinase